MWIWKPDGILTLNNSSLASVSLQLKEKSEEAVSVAKCTQEYAGKHWKAGEREQEYWESKGGYQGKIGAAEEW